MKRLIVCLCLLLACILPCTAQNSSSASAVPPNTWPFAALDTMAAADIIVGYPDGTYGGRRPVTRYEFAVATARILSMAASPPPNPLSNLATNVPIQLKASPLAVSAFLALIKEFSPELIRLGQDVPKSTARLEALQKQQREDIRAGKIVPTAKPLSSPFADIPYTSKAWQVQAIDAVQKAGIVLIKPEKGDTSGLSRMTRLQMAQSLVRVFSKKPFLDIIDQLERHMEALDATRTLVYFYQPELTLLGVDAMGYEQRLDDLNR